MLLLPITSIFKKLVNRFAKHYLVFHCTPRHLGKLIWRQPREHESCVFIWEIKLRFQNNNRFPNCFLLLKLLKYLFKIFCSIFNTNIKLIKKVFNDVRIFFQRNSYLFNTIYFVLITLFKQHIVHKFYRKRVLLLVTHDVMLHTKVFKRIKVKRPFKYFFKLITSDKIILRVKGYDAKQQTT